MALKKNQFGAGIAEHASSPGAVSRLKAATPPVEKAGRRQPGARSMWVRAALLRGTSRSLPLTHRRALDPFGTCRLFLRKEQW